MTKQEELEEMRQEALAELKDCVRCADWTDEDYVDCVSKKALKVAIEMLEREVSRSYYYEEPLF